MTKFTNGTMREMKLSEGGDGFGGEVKIARLLEPTKVRLVKVDHKRSDDSPDYIVETVDIDHEGNGYWAESGAAWIKQLKDDKGIFLSISLDMADRPAAINLAAFVADQEDQTEGEGQLWRFTYSRPRARRQRRAEAHSDNNGSVKTPSF